MTDAMECCRVARALQARTNIPFVSFRWAKRVIVCNMRGEGRRQDRLMWMVVVSGGGGQRGEGRLGPGVGLAVAGLEALD